MSAILVGFSVVVTAVRITCKLAAKSDPGIQSSTGWGTLTDELGDFSLNLLAGFSQSAAQSLEPSPWEILRNGDFERVTCAALSTAIRTVSPPAGVGAWGACGAWYQRWRLASAAKHAWPHFNRHEFYRELAALKNLDAQLAAYHADPAGRRAALLKQWHSFLVNAAGRRSAHFPPELLHAAALSIHERLPRLLEHHVRRDQPTVNALLTAGLDKLQAGQVAMHQDVRKILTIVSNAATPSGSSDGPPCHPIPSAKRYFGRVDLVAELVARLRGREQRIEVWGGAGLGKTALTAEAVREILGAGVTSAVGSPFPDGIVFLDLYQDLKGGTDTAWNKLADAFDASLSTDLPARERAARACAGRRALVILEGAEELVTAEALDDFLTPLAPETTRLVLTREMDQTAAARRIELHDLLHNADALALLQHLAGARAPRAILEAVEERLGGHPLALTWAASQLADGREPAAEFLAAMQAAPFNELKEPAGKTEHTLRWLFDRTRRRLQDSAQHVLAAATRVSAPLDAAFAVAAGGSRADLQALVSVAFLRSDDDGWHFAHALAAGFARDLPLAAGALERLGEWAVAGLRAADAAYATGSGHGPLDRALRHATALLSYDASGVTLEPVYLALMYHGRQENTVGIERGRLDFARRALEAVAQWQANAPDDIRNAPSQERESSVVSERLGNLAVAQGDLAGAMRSFTESKTISERLAASDRANAEWQRDLSVSLNKLGDLAVAQGDLAGAMRSFTESKTIFERLAASDPANAAWQRDLSYSCWVIAAKVFQPQKRWAEALKLMEQSLSISERLAATDPTNVTWQNDVQVSRKLVAELRAKVAAL